MPLVRRSAFLTAGCPENGEDHNRGVVVRSFFGSVCMTCGAWPPCHKVGTLVHVGGGGADVVAAAGEAAHCRGGCLHWRDRQCHLPPDPRLFGFNGLVVAPS
jgi:hypothetical protein